MSEARPIVLLDLDDTILDFQTAEAGAIRRAFAALDIPVTDALIARYSDINRQHWELLEEGKLTREQVLVRRFDVLFAELGLDRSGAEAAARYENELCRGHWFMPGAEALLDAIGEKYRLVIVSNGVEKVQEARLASAGIAPRFAHIFLSERLGAEKPSAAFFARALSQIPDFDPARAVLVGDSLTSDIRGAKNAGLRAVWYNARRRSPRADIVPDYVICDLAELPPLLEHLFS